MLLCSQQAILSATKPQQIYSMDPNTIDAEYEAYCEKYKKGQKYRELTNFVVLQQINYLYKLAQSVLANKSSNYDLSGLSGQIVLKRPNGGDFAFRYTYHVTQGVCEIYSNNEFILFEIDEQCESKYGFYTNYISKVSELRCFWEAKDERDYNDFQYFIPNITKYFHDKENGKYVIIIKKPHLEDRPCRVYSLREVLNYFDGRLSINYVVSIVKRLYSIACHIDIANMCHNGIVLDNIYFSPGRFILPGEKYTVEDMRIVGLYGGWFFTTYKDERVQGMPSVLSGIIPKYVIETKYSSFEVDMLAIKKVARELLGDITGENLYGVHSLLADWFNRTTCEKNAYEEYARFEYICEEVFGKPKFLEMDISI